MARQSAETSFRSRLRNHRPANDKSNWKDQQQPLESRNHNTSKKNLQTEIAAQDSALTALFLARHEPIKPPTLSPSLILFRPALPSLAHHCPTQFCAMVGTAPGRLGLHSKHLPSLLKDVDLSFVTVENNTAPSKLGDDEKAEKRHPGRRVDKAAVWRRVLAPVK